MKRKVWRRTHVDLRSDPSYIMFYPLPSSELPIDRADTLELAKPFWFSAHLKLVSKDEELETDQKAFSYSGKFFAVSSASSTSLVPMARRCSRKMSSYIQR